MTIRTGWGFDAHRVEARPPLLLGGVVVSEDYGVAATSDGDVVAHATVDAILGAAVLGDMGEHFPSHDPAYHDADSMALLETAVAMAHDAGWVPSHVDVTVVAQLVRVAPFRSGIRAGLANVLGIPVGAVSVKATTTDGMGFTGSGEGIAAIAVVTMVAAE